MKFKLCLFLISSVLFAKGYSQTISIHSITASRQTGGFNGYTLDDGLMIGGSRLKLLSPANFGSSGTYPKTVTIFDGYGTSGSLTGVSNIAFGSIFFFGAFNILDSTTQPFTNSEIDALYDWSIQGGKLIIASCAAIANLYDTNVLNNKWGYSHFLQVPSTVIPNAFGNGTDIFSGPFGNVALAYQAASSQGYFDALTNNSQVLGTDATGNPTLFMDCNTLDLIIADVDVYTSLSGISAGTTITNDQDRFWANTIVFMDKLQPPPIVEDNSNLLTLNSTYNDYQWYLNDTLVDGGTNPDFTATGNGNYYAEVTVNGGCKIKSNVVTINSFFEPPVLEMPNIITPNNDGLNDFFNPIKKKGLTITQISIFNRWGNLVHQENSPTVLWDGKAGNQRVSDGVYYWVIEYETSGGERKSEEGVLHIFR
jgi:gliding motility-associated-like protein